MADGWSAVGFLFAWGLALFLSLGGSFLAYGGTLAVSALVGAIGGLTLGRHIDAGHGSRAVWLAVLVMATIIFLRAIATRHTALVVLANALRALGACVYVPTVMTAVYTMAKRSPCTLRFHVATEGGWDAGGAAGLLITATATEFALPLGESILLSLAGLAAIAILLRRYYAESDRLDPGPVSGANAAPAARPIPAAIEMR
jgi:DHA1 family inner membrane transport protein